MRAVKHAHADHTILRCAQDKLPRLVGIVGWHIGRCLHFAGRFGRGRRAEALTVMPLQVTVARASRKLRKGIDCFHFG